MHSNNVYFQNNPNLFLELVEIVNTTKYISNYLTKQSPTILQWVDSLLTDKLSPDKYSIQTRIHWIMNGLTDFPVCPVCGKRDNFITKYHVSIKHGYPKFCCRHCADNSSEVKSQRSKTWKQTFADNKDAILEKMRNTCLEKYGVETFTNREKAQATCKEKYGVDNVSQLVDVKTKKKETCKKNYGVEVPVQNKTIAQKIRETMFEKYGVENSFNMAKNREASAYAIQKKAYESLFANEYDSPNFSFNEFRSRETDLVSLEFKCKKCGQIFKVKHHDGVHNRCPYCWPSAISELTSNQEKELRQFLVDELGVSAQFNVRSIISPYELDIYVPEHNIAIEYNGLYWHNIKNKPDPLYHLNKTLLCEQKNILLIHIFENEWINRRSQVKLYLRQMLNNDVVHIDATKCSVNEISVEEAMSFYNENSIEQCDRLHELIHCGVFNSNKIAAAFSYFKTNSDIMIQSFAIKHNMYIDNIALVLHKLFADSNVFMDFNISHLLHHVLGETFLKKTQDFSPRQWKIGPNLMLSLVSCEQCAPEEIISDCGIRRFQLILE